MKMLVFLMVKITVESNAKGIKVDLKPGDMLIYSGCELEHWREAFQGKDCVQVFYIIIKFLKKQIKINLIKESI